MVIIDFLFLPSEFIFKLIKISFLTCAIHYPFASKFTDASQLLLQGKQSF